MVRKIADIISDSSLSVSHRIRNLLEYCGEPESPAQLRQRSGELLDLINAFTPYQLPATDIRREPLAMKMASARPGEDEDERFCEVALEDGHFYALIGDLHGDYTALDSILRYLFPVSGTEYDPDKVHMIFLGDLLDRGRRDFHVLSLVIALRVLLGDKVIQLRGNHEEIYLHESGEFRSSVEGGDEMFVNYYRSFLSDNFMSALARYFDWLPHLIFLRHNSGEGIAVVHGGVPPGFLQKRYPTIPEMLGFENTRRAFLWGRPAEREGPRPVVPYTYKWFYNEDVSEFCSKFKLRYIVRGHDVQTRGFGLMADGNVITIHSSGTAIGADNADTATGNVSLPRFLIIHPEKLFKNRSSAKDRSGLDDGISVKEVFSRDVLILVAAVTRATEESLIPMARRISDRLREVLDLPVHILRREGYTLEKAEEIEFLPARKADYDRQLDQGYHFREAYVLEERDGELVFAKWALPPRIYPGGEARQVRRQSDIAYADKCVELIKENLK
jgi:hypothetical protein